MGCFNVSCGVSGLSMYCDDAVLIPLVQVETLQMGGGHLVSNDGIKQFFAPLTLPIFGNLDSYGRLEDIKRDANVECIEKFFGMNIDQFAEKVLLGDNALQPVVLIQRLAAPQVAGMYVHQSIFKTMVSQAPSECRNGSNWSIWDYGDLTDDVLALIGFSYKTEDKTRERYNRLWRNPKFPEIEIWSDRRWIRVQYIAPQSLCKGNMESCYSLKDLVALIENKTKRTFPKTLKRKLQKTAYYHVLCETAKSEDHLFKHKWIYSVARESAYNLLGRTYVGGVDLFMSIYGKHLGETQQALVALKIFEMNMHGVNRLYMPSWNGHQHGNHQAHEMVAKATLRVLWKKTRGL